jgi:hypothetical protein
LIINYCILVGAFAAILDCFFIHTSPQITLFTILCSAAYLLVPYGIDKKNDNVQYAYVELERVPISLFITGEKEMTFFSMLVFYIQLPFVEY